MRDEVPSWRLSALCAQVDLDLHFPERAKNANLQSQQAKELCRRCTVREPCLAEALDRGETNGVWGGTTVRDRRKLLGQVAKDKY